jgi:hypothetical protein
MQASNNGASPAAVAAAVAGLWRGSLGFTVRCTPRRRVLVASADGSILFAKLRDGRRRDARAEWHWLHALPALGLRVPLPVAFDRAGSRTLVCTAAAPGRPLDVLLRAAVRRDPAAALRYACRVVAPVVRRLHDAGLVFRDLYWNHLFAHSIAGGDEPVFVDVERVFRPRWRRRRWIVKDLAGLSASLPVAAPPRALLRFLRSYLGDGRPGRAARRGLARDVARKAARIRAHEPRHG